MMASQSAIGRKGTPRDLPRPTAIAAMRPKPSSVVGAALAIKTLASLRRGVRQDVQDFDRTFKTLLSALCLLAMGPDLIGEFGLP